jgi:tetratricopeptide (TPR) repeat protein
MIATKQIAAIAVLMVTGSVYLRASDTLKITIPRRSESTAVQRLNRAGVEAIKKQHIEQAASLFYKAYLYDPGDPFTLNNLGYVSELQGELDRARKFYALASEQGSSAEIDKSNVSSLEGKPMLSAFEVLQDVPMRVNRMNIDAMDLLSKQRGFQAVALLHQALSLDPNNPFTLNNMGVAEEAIGDFDNALLSYKAAARTNSLEPVVVAQDRSWRGKPVSAMAAASSKRLQQRIDRMDSAEMSAVLFTLRGVAATNQNDWPAAKKAFLRAYELNPSSAFSLNNRGYVAEMDGDFETAEFFYQKAGKADDAEARVGLATQHSAEGRPLSNVAADSNKQVDHELEKYSEERRREPGPVELTPRFGTPGGASTASPEEPQHTDTPGATLPPLPESQNPPQEDNR